MVTAAATTVGEDGAAKFNRMLPNRTTAISTTTKEMAARRAGGPSKPRSQTKLAVEAPQPNRKTTPHMPVIESICSKDRLSCCE